ncbi:hypothetical protein [Streptomyces antarcticus]|uniref:hypothetical protein n=1 Tax=Streptomyces antarcticus TaxID=2996458 RepID=UPI00227142DD|nr:MULTISPECIES: hypothetical protein [unclassified Streptomyces]MCY0943629.1 hypothetical protein [Streptomyces sp. H34-AA3]MCZ4086023.1 hypothetical protein [Streptomyces sp. H34-S5]
MTEANAFAPPPGHVNTLAWSSLDDYLWHSCEIVADLLTGGLARRPLLATTARLARDDRALAVGPGQRSTWRAPGNGRYQHNSVVAVGNPAFVIGSLLGSAVGNSARRRQAARDAQSRWMVDGSGEVTITRQKLHFASSTIGLDLDWKALSTIDLVSVATFQTSFVNTRGQQVTTMVHTPWASLAFAVAAITAFPAHPRLLSGGWIPPGFEQKCARLGRPCRPAATLAAPQ